MWNNINQTGRLAPSIDTFRTICESGSVFWCILGSGWSVSAFFGVKSALAFGLLFAAARRRRSCSVAPRLGPSRCASAGEPKLPAKLTVLFLEIRRICASLLLRGFPDRLCNGIARSHAVHLLACNADRRPLHCCERVRSP